MVKFSSLGFLGALALGALGSLNGQTFPVIELALERGRALDRLERQLQPSNSNVVARATAMSNPFFREAALPPPDSTAVVEEVKPKITPSQILAQAALLISPEVQGRTILRRSPEEAPITVLLFRGNRRVSVGQTVRVNLADGAFDVAIGAIGETTFSITYDGISLDVPLSRSRLPEGSVTPSP